MAIISMPLPSRIQTGIKVETELNQLSSKFGYGTEQTVIKGFRAVRYKISLSWDALNQTECNTVMAAISQQINNPGDRITYALPNDSATVRKWTVKNISYSYPDVGFTSISVELREAFV